MTGGMVARERRLRGIPTMVTARLFSPFLGDLGVLF
jgi:hypothetical protein